METKRMHGHDYAGVGFLNRCSTSSGCSKML
jgi:hypothetical protein